MKQRLINLVMKYIIKKYFKTHSFVDFSDEKIWSIYHRMNTPDIVDALRHRFTNIFADHYSKGGDSFLLAKGRLFEINDLLEDIESAEDKLLRIAEIKRKEELRSGVSNSFGQMSTNKIKNKLKGFKIKNKNINPEE